MRGITTDGQTTPILCNRATYRKEMLPVRLSAIRNSVEKHKPRNVVFYGRVYRVHWEKIVGHGFCEDDGLLIADKCGTQFICTMHPAAHISGKVAYWRKVGERLRQNLNRV